MPGSTRPAALVLAMALTAAACSSGRGGPSPGATAAPAGTSGPGTGPEPGAARVTLTRIADLDAPLAMAVHPGDGALYVAEKTGRVRAVRGGTVDPTPVLDLGAEVSDGTEQGLLGLAFSPDGRFLYVNFTDRAGNTHVTEFAFASGRADRATRRDVLRVAQPFPNHNGGNLVFGPDGRLWIGLGDGGGAGDPYGNAQNLGVLLGKMLRIDPRPSDGRPYSVPPDNPFVGRAGARPEIWAYGLRNPWRYSFDRATGDLWIGDVGQDAWEEIDVVAAGSRGGLDFGWNRLEGSHRFRGAAPGAEPANAVLPVHEYGHEGAVCAVTGGYVYRGARIPALDGVYLFADFCVGRVMGLTRAGGRTLVRDLGIATTQLSSFGQDASGELYVMSLDGAVSRIDPG